MNSAFCKRLAAAANSFDFNLVPRFAQTGGINEHNRQPADIGGFFNRVARRARNGRDDGAIMAEQLIQQAGFASVRAANNGCANATA